MHWSRFVGIFLVFSVFSLVNCQCDSGELFVVRLSTNPIMNNTRMCMVYDNDININFPSVIKTPIWLKNRLYPIIGRGPEYLKYFSDHHGKEIFMAYTDDVRGPWVVHAPGTLKLSQVLDAFNASSVNDTKSEIASADIYIDHANKTVRMYFHRRVPNDNYAIISSIAYSKDGINFGNIDTRNIGTAYIRHFVHDGYIYLTDRVGKLWRSRDGINNLEPGSTTIGNAFTNYSMVNGDGYTGLLRHLGLIKSGDYLYIYGTRVGDAPERILRTKMRLTNDWTTWNAEYPAKEGFRPETDYEGANLPNLPSKKGSANEPVNQLRDPFPFYDMGRCYMFYTVAGESGIAVARLPKCWENK
ncbi:hypothetical protein [Niemeyer virus]|uniref:Glycosyl hydrolase n=1 Tax=Acanthamoeba polyphaga mimivirus Kroon TaxID=3069720 RepID=A0A0G2Y7Q5_9VIRU|nr:hypothetical protein QJ850_gp847 [Acanthamoeba polyphaga mimivirus]AKI79852.1 hypothetical protein [Acanthamoeba polyphaga mimivirus Kroon]ALR83711.1 hypothetical protein [Niemeyer virus]